MSAPHVPKRSNAIRHLERNDNFQATASIWSYVDRLETSSRIEDVTSTEGPEAFGWRGRFAIGCKSLYSHVPRRTVSASTVSVGESGSVVDHAPRLSPSSEVAMEVSVTNGDSIVLIVGRGTIRGVGCVVILVPVHVWHHSIRRRARRRSERSTLLRVSPSAVAMGHTIDR